jgi:hypothetical protein
LKFGIGCGVHDVFISSIRHAITHGSHNYHKGALPIRLSDLICTVYTGIANNGA